MIKDKNILIELHCLPSIEYFKLIVNNSTTIEQYENYNKRSYRNKFKLLSPNGTKTISIPLQKGKNRGMLITNVKIAYEDKWVRELERSLISYYKNAPYFDHYFSSLMNIFKSNEEYLYVLNTKLLAYIKDQLRLDFTLNHTKEYQKTPQKINDYRNTILPKNILSKKVYAYDYGQVFEYKFGFTPSLSVLDLLFNMGPEGYFILKD